MDLLDDLNTNATAEQRFMFMLLERVDALTDTVNNMENSLTMIKKNMPLIVEEHSNMFSHACFLNNDTHVHSKRTYCRLYIKSKEECDRLKNHLLSLDYIYYVMSFTLHSTDVSELFAECDGHFYIFQCMIEFKWKKYVSHLLLDMYSGNEDIFYKDEHTDNKCCFFNDINNDLISVYYELTITAGQLNMPITQAKDITILQTEGRNEVNKMYSVMLSHLTPNDVMSRYFIVHNENSGIGHAYTPAFIVAILPKHLSC